jgi:hypothetical protein
VTDALVKRRRKFAPREFKRGPGLRGRARLEARLRRLLIDLGRFARTAQGADVDWATGLFEQLRSRDARERDRRRA